MTSTGSNWVHRRPPRSKLGSTNTTASPPRTSSQGESSYISDAEINDWAEARLNEDLNGDGTIGTAADDRVAFLESRKAAAALGATDEWNKMEGVAFNPEASNVLYLAMSSISNAMTDAQGDIDLAENSCGIVYRMTMNTTWNVNRIDPAIVGGPYTSSAEYQCNIDNLAGPDNLLVLDDGRVLVGEDTWRHEHNTVWLWQAASSDMVGSEVLTANVTALSDDTADGALVHHAEMSDLQPGRTYTVNLLVSDAATGEAEGQVNWRDITSESKLGRVRLLSSRARSLERLDGHEFCYVARDGTNSESPPPRLPNEQ